jgi:hypothetical protein
MRKYLSTFILSGALCVPLVALHAQDRDDHQRNRSDQRYYDTEHKDYHNWNGDEDRAWHHWLETNHRNYHDWAKANKREQRDYWKWRHEHSDWH